MCAEVFTGGSVQYAFTTIPTYPSGQIGFMLCSKGEKVDFKAPKQPIPAAPRKGAPALLRPLRYYTGDVHKAAFVLPQYANEALQGALTED